MCSARNAGAWINEFVASLVAQSHTDWELWVRNDGSTDDTAARLEQWRQREPRVVHIIHGDRAIGIAQGFGDVLKRLPADAQVVATGDADDVWLPHRLASSLSTLERAERDAPGPVLVHSDLCVVDDQLYEKAPSYWRAEGIDPDLSSLSALAIQNVAVNPTLLFNGALLAEVRDVPQEAVFLDWWLALVAASTGRIVADRTPTVLYRQHAGNAVGARRGSTLTRLPGALTRRPIVRQDLDRISLQARALLAKYRDRLRHEDCRALEGLASIAELHGWRRKTAIARWRWFPVHGVLRNLGILVRG
ncbi:MAG: glycosyltransferase [Gemmatimonadaceae bacterium]|nr:glycosyltransferase [Gemmatimonadaceae bacterium]